MRGLHRLLVLSAAIAAAIFVGNTSRWIRPIAGQPAVLAHKGVGQSFDLTNIKNDDCTATRMLPPKHAFLENTIVSIAEAFKLGADVVELDIHPTSDGQFAVFHDWRLECRTNGTGATRKSPMGYLKTLDIGHGYTADGGKTFPFRGFGVGLMPTLDEVLEAFPSQSLLINVKSNDPAEGHLLSDYLARLPASRRASLMVYGGDAPLSIVRARHPASRTMSRATLTSCYLRYVALGWSGYVPSDCRNSVLLTPTNVGPWLWGWPHRFQQRMAHANTIFFAVAPYHGGGFSNGIDSEATLGLLPEGYTGGISTDRVDHIAPLVRGRKPRG